jgi:uncharacterized membrane protein
MNARKAAMLVLKVLALTIVMLVGYIVAGTLFGSQVESTDQAGGDLLPLLIVSFLNTAVLTYPIVRSRWSGWRLVAVVFVVLFGISYFMTQIETAVFVTNLPSSEIGAILLIGATVTLIFSPLAVLILGKMRRSTAEEGPNLRLVMPWTEWVWKLAVIAVAYLILYSTFGYFVAWQSAALREFYSGSTELLGFFEQWGNTILGNPGLVPFQILRALLWVVLALPVIRMMKGRWWEAALAVALLFAVLMNAQLLLPNPYMPQTVRMWHLVETASSNFILGWLIVWLLNRHHSSLRELLQW